MQSHFHKRIYMPLVSTEIKEFWLLWIIHEFYRILCYSFFGYSLTSNISQKVEALGRTCQKDDLDNKEWEMKR